MSNLAANKEHANELRQIERFANGDEAAAKEAFDALSGAIRSFLGGYLHKYLPSKGDREDRDDVILEVLTKIWQHRHSFVYQGDGAWWGYVATIAKRCVYDRPPERGELVILADPVDPDIEAIQRYAWYRHDLARLYRAADQLWLGIDRSQKESKKQIVAALLFYADGCPWQQVLELVGRGRVTRTDP